MILALLFIAAPFIGWAIGKAVFRFLERGGPLVPSKASPVKRRGGFQPVVISEVPSRFAPTYIRSDHLNELGTSYHRQEVARPPNPPRQDDYSSDRTPYLPWVI